MVQDSIVHYIKAIILKLAKRNNTRLSFFGECLFHAEYPLVDIASFVPFFIVTAFLTSFSVKL